MEKTRLSRRQRQAIKKIGWSRAQVRDWCARDDSANRGHDARNERLVKELRERFGTPEGNKHAKNVLAMASAVVVALGGG